MPLISDRRRFVCDYEGCKREERVMDCFAAGVQIGLSVVQ